MRGSSLISINLSCLHKPVVRNLSAFAGKLVKPTSLLLNHILQKTVKEVASFLVQFQPFAARLPARLIAT
jgi:hypothetical protein